MSKKFICSFIFLIVSLTASFAKQVPIVISDEEFDRAEIVTRITKVREPYIQSDYLIFTADKGSRFVGIAFDFEDFKTIHSYQIRNLKDNENNTVDSILFYMLKLPKRLTKINYRIVVDGLWTLDPTNQSTEFDVATGLTLSSVDVTRYIAPATEVQETGVVRFVYKGTPGQQVRLGGSFTNWDSWIYEMQEVSAGLYQFELPLPPGIYEYAFYTGVTPITDKSNPDRCYTPDGKEASRLVVKAF